MNVFDLDDELSSRSAFRIKSFSQYDEEWLQYVVDCRRGGMMQQAYDVIEGGVANDNVIDGYLHFVSSYEL